MELVDKGIIIPVDKRETEIEYLNSLINFRLPESAFFRCKSLTESQLSVLENKSDDKVIFCSIPYDFGAGIPGTRYGPRLLRSMSNSITFRGKNNILLDLESKSNVFEGKEIYDIGDINLPLDSKSCSLAKVQKLAYNICTKGIPFFVGGDHLFSLPIIEAIHSYIKVPFLVVQLDYHLDIQLGGEFNNNMPRVLTEPTHANFIYWLKFKVPELEILQVGVNNYNSIDSKISIEDAFLYLKNIGTQISNTEIFSSSKEDILRKLPVGQRVYLTIDVDVLNRIYSKYWLSFAARYRYVRFL